MKFIERRKRLRRPLWLVVFGVGLILIPVINYIAAAFAQDLPLHFYQVIFRNFGPVAVGIMLLSVVAGVGLLRIKKWGWWLALFTAIAMTAHNLAVLVQSQAYYNLSALVLTVFAISLLLYFTRKDISAPYLKMYPRGFRFQKRTPVRIEIKINGAKHQTTDLSEHGLYAEPTVDADAIGRECTVEVSNGAGTLQLAAVVVRRDDNGAGFAFRNLNRAQKLQLRKIIQAV
ncbi:MAG: PilZ domain-containing protein [bacterium]|nr:PilZ domain-containing protein [bacterium]